MTAPYPFEVGTFRPPRRSPFPYLNPDLAEDDLETPGSQPPRPIVLFPGQHLPLYTSHPTIQDFLDDARARLLSMLPLHHEFHNRVESMITGQLLPIQPEGRARTMYPDGWRRVGAGTTRTMREPETDPTWNLERAWFISMWNEGSRGRWGEWEVVREKMEGGFRRYRVLHCQGEEPSGGRKRVREEHGVGGDFGLTGEQKREEVERKRERRRKLLAEMSGYGEAEEVEDEDTDTEMFGETEAGELVEDDGGDDSDPDEMMLGMERSISHLEARLNEWLESKKDKVHVQDDQGD